MMVVAMMMTIPVVAVVTMVMPMAAVMMVMPPMTVVVMSPLYVGRQLTCVALPGDDPRTDRSRRLRVLRGSRDNQKRAESGQS